MNVLKSVAQIFRRPSADLTTLENKSAYEAGWRSEDTGEQNPCVKGSPQYLAWEKGWYDRSRDEMLVW